jgi:hypothetical protein
MRILALAILAIGTVSIGPAAAQKYDPAYPVCLHKYGLGGSTITIAATRRCLSATRRHRAARHSASSIHISRARKSPGNDIIGGILASTKDDLAAASVSVPIGAAPLARKRVLGIDPAIGESTARGGHALGVAGELAIAGIAPLPPLQAVAILYGLSRRRRY